MNTKSKFDSIVASLPKTLEKLLASPALNRDNIGVLPERGIYLFFEDNEPIYAGRSNRLRKRILEHGRQSSMHNSATLAFNIALKASKDLGFNFPQMSRERLQHDPEFRPYYLEAKERVSEMMVRVVEVADPIEQTLFEVYAALALGTPFNEFENH